MSNFLKDNKELMKEYNYNKNSDINLEKLKNGSNICIWWKCGKGHEWEAKISDRSQGSGCPYCSNKKILVGFNDLATTNPELAKQWHPTKNGKLTPQDVTKGSGKIVWWLDDCGHEYEKSVANKNSGQKCPYCNNTKVLIGFNDLATTNPELAKQWHPTKNKNLMPNNITARSIKRVWWKCDVCGHEWNTVLSVRVDRKSGCPKCNIEKSTSFPEQAIYYYCSKYFKAYNRYIIKNLEVDIYLKDISTAIEYDGMYYHSSPEKKERDLKKNNILEKSSIKLYRIIEYNENKIVGNNIYYKVDSSYKELPWAIKKLFKYLKINSIDVNIDSDSNKIYESYISIVKANSIENKYPYLVKEWNYEKNGVLKPNMISSKSGKKVWWKCSKGHEWQAAVSSRVKNHNCPYCYGRFAIKGVNDLKTTNPKLLAEWNYEKNNIKPEEVKASSHNTVWWKCSKGHEWQARISHRTNGVGCPYCKNKKVLKGYNDLETTDSELVKEWNYNKNSSLSPFEVTRGSRKKVWWICNKGHEWMSSIQNRAIMNHNCPYCSNQRVLIGYNDLATTNPKLVKEWNYNKNGKLKPTMVVCGSNKKVWWKCNKGHEWEASIFERNKGTGCPLCYNNRK